MEAGAGTHVVSEALARSVAVPEAHTSAVSGADGVVNALTVDVEDYFHVAALDGAFSRHSWDQLEPRVQRNTCRLLELFAEAEVHATMFVLGWVAERFPDLVREIGEAGHELAVHGHLHRPLEGMSPEEFRHDLRQAKGAVEDAAGRPVAGFRAPNVSLTPDTLWAIDILCEEGFLYDSSMFPVRYRFTGGRRSAHRLRGPAGGEIYEFPVATLRVLGVNLPLAGGNYLRQFPLRWTQWAIRRMNRREGLAANLYIHPWEIDPDQPRVEVGPLRRLRHYRNLDRMEERLRALLAEFRFAPLEELLGF